MPGPETDSLEFLDSDRILKVSDKVVAIFKMCEQGEGCREAGGILLGKVAKDRVIITDVTTPNRFDLRSFLSFVRAKIPAQFRINKAWKKSTGTTIYFGEWHTHREINPLPSLQDKKMILKALRETKMEIDFLYLIIVGLSETYWVGKQTDRDLIKLELIQRTLEFSPIMASL